MNSYLLSIFCFSVLAGPQQEGCEEAPPTPGLMSVAFAQEKAGEPRLQRVFVGTVAEFEKEHLENSALLDLAWVRGEVNGVKGELLPPEQWVKKLGEQGVDSRFWVLLYGNRVTDVALAGWALTNAGFSHWYILDGGLSAWKKAKLDVQSGGTPGYGKKSSFEISKPLDSQAKLSDVIAASEGKGAKLLDSRPAEQYAAGFIPGAINLPWPDLLKEDGTFKPIPELRKSFSDAGFTSESEAIVYCNTGHQASVNYFVLRYLLGRDKARIYDGSLAEWKLDPKRPLKKL